MNQPRKFWHKVETDKPRQFWYEQPEKEDPANNKEREFWYEKRKPLTQRMLDTLRDAFDPAAYKRYEFLNEDTVSEIMLGSVRTGLYRGQNCIETILANSDVSDGAKAIGKIVAAPFTAVADPIARSIAVRIVKLDHYIQKRIAKATGQQYINFMGTAILVPKEASQTKYQE